MSDWITFALPKGRIMQDTMELLGQLGITCAEMESNSRKLVFENREDRYRFMAVRATDVPTYVEYGCADIGVVGKDSAAQFENRILRSTPYLPRNFLPTAARTCPPSSQAPIHAPAQ